MRVSLVIGAVLMAVGVHSEKTKQVCYPHVGCFDNSPPFDNVLGYLPISPEILDIKFKLYTPMNIAQEQYLSYTDVSSISNSLFDAKLPVKIIIHGYLSHATDNWVTKTKTEILIKEKANVIGVDWSNGANTVVYKQAVADTRLVAMQTTLLLTLMVEHHNVSLENVHIIGHSLGAHTAGYIGHMLNSKIGRITALEAAELKFKNKPLSARVDSSDAMFVDAIHTDAAPYSLLGASGGLGLMEAFGHVDFYVNGGKKQPGCKTPVEKVWDFFRGKRSIGQLFACSHVRSHELFTASINSPCTFTSLPCESYDKFKRGECSCGGQGCSVMGYSADKFSGRGKQWLDTFAEEPFCGYQYKIIFDLENSQYLEGELTITFTGEDDVTSSSATVKTADAHVDGSGMQAVIIVDKKLQIKTVVVRFKPKLYYIRAIFDIQKLEVISLGTNVRHRSVPGSYSAGDKIAVEIPMIVLDSDDIIVG